MISKKDFDLNWFEDNIYLQYYIDLMNDYEFFPKQKFKTQAHHIIPRKYFKLCGKEVDNSYNNLVNLLYKDHVKAHYFLALCTKGQLKYANENAIWHVLGNSNYLKDPNYNIEKTMLSNLDKWQDLMEDLYKTRSILYKGKTYKPNTEEHKKQISIKNKGNIYIRKFINDNWIVRKAKNIEEFNLLISEGWEKGNRPRNVCTPHKGKSIGEAVSNGKKGKICINNLYINKYITTEELPNYLSQGWQLGGRKLGIRKRVKVIKLDKILSIFEDELAQYEDKGWEKYDN